MESLIIMIFRLLVLLLLLALDFAVLGFIFLLLLGSLYLVSLVILFKAFLGSWVDMGPHVTDDLGDLGYFGGRVLGLDAIIDFLPVKEKSRKGTLGRHWLRYQPYLLFRSFPFYPLYNKLNTSLLLFIYVQICPFYLYTRITNTKFDWIIPSPSDFCALTAPADSKTYPILSKSLIISRFTPKVCLEPSKIMIKS